MPQRCRCRHWIDPPSTQAQLALRAGFTALRELATPFGIQFDPDPAPGAPITIARDEWESVVNRFEAVGLPVKADRDQAWRDFAGWRVNYDSVLVELAAVLAAPVAPWSSDRALSSGLPKVRILIPGSKPRL